MSNGQPTDEEIKCMLRAIDMLLRTIYGSSTPSDDIKVMIDFLESIVMNDADPQTQISHWIILDKANTEHRCISETEYSQIIDKILGRPDTIKSEINKIKNTSELNDIKEMISMLSESTPTNHGQILDMINDHIELIELLDKENNR